MIDITLNQPKAYMMSLHTQKKYILNPDGNLMELVYEDNMGNFLGYEKKPHSQSSDNVRLGSLSNFSPKLQSNLTNLVFREFPRRFGCQNDPMPPLGGGVHRCL
jgi:hypothetical protein